MNLSEVSSENTQPLFSPIEFPIVYYYTSIFYVHPGDIRLESWGTLEPAEAPVEDHNANFHGKSMDFHKEPSMYTKAKKVKEGQHTVRHTVWQTRGPASSQSGSDGEPVAVTKVGTREFLTSLGELPDIGPNPLDVELTEPRGHVDESGFLTLHEVYAVGRVEENSELVVHHG
jgi:hypothetical protein